MKRHIKLMAVTAAGAILSSSLAACASNDSETSSAEAGSGGDSVTTLTVWDPYPQFDDSSEWTQLVTSCGEEAGVTVERTGYDTTDLTNKTLLAAQQGAAPNVVIVDNPVVSTLADAGVLNDTETLGLDTSGFEPNILAAGEVDDATYGVPIGANTLALYYNADVLEAAGVDPDSVTDWASLTSALEQITASGAKGITFSAIGTEEGSFQFLPWFWGSGAELTALDSPEAVSALDLWKGWLEDGLAPNSVINNTQTTAWQEFETGDYGFVENGTWQLANADAAAFDYGVIPIPGSDGGAAPAPTGGEFVAAPVQEDDSAIEATTALIDCLTSPDNLVTTDNTLSYVAPVAAAQETQVASNPALEPWVEAVGAARGRTSDNLGTQYPVISEQLWGAVQLALSGQSAEESLGTAQQAAGS